MGADKTITIKPGQTILIDATRIGVTAFVTRLRDWAMPQRYGTVTDTLVCALANLIGITDVEAVKIANEYARRDGNPTITTKQFRHWLPTALSAIFAEWKAEAEVRG